MKNCTETKNMEEKINMLSAHIANSDTESKRITSLMTPEFYECSYEEKSVSLAFPVTELVLNPAGVMMGGLIATAFDTTNGILIFALDGKLIPPTISLNINYVKPIQLGDKLIVTAKIENFGSKIIHITTVGVSEQTGKTVATATTTFLSTVLMVKKS